MLQSLRAHPQGSLEEVAQVGVEKVGMLGTETRGRLVPAGGPVQAQVFL